MSHDEDAASSSTKTLAADKDVTQSNTITHQPLTQIQRMQAINAALENGNLTELDAQRAHDAFLLNLG
jgi:homoserine acetyltransferase